MLLKQFNPGFLAHTPVILGHSHGFRQILMECISELDSLLIAFEKTDFIIIVSDDAKLKSLLVTSTPLRLRPGEEPRGVSHLTEPIENVLG